jgi:hypothetical protein
MLGKYFVITNQQHMAEHPVQNGDPEKSPRCFFLLSEQEISRIVPQSIQDPS